MATIQPAFLPFESFIWELSDEIPRRGLGADEIAIWASDIGPDEELYGNVANRMEINQAVLKYSSAEDQYVILFDLTRGPLLELRH